MGLFDQIKAIWSFGRGVQTGKVDPTPYMNYSPINQGTKDYYSNKFTSKNSSPFNPYSTYEPEELQSQDKFISDYVNSLGIKKAGSGINLGSLYSAYGEEADASKSALNFATTTKRADLTTAIQRLREDIAKSKEAKQQAYQGTRADIEEAGFMATRANRASAASKGLAGSGLEQLAQLQQMISQGKTISKEANVNQLEQDDLRQELSREETDYTGNIQNLTEAQKVGLQEIAAQLSSKKASAASQASAASAAATANYNNAISAAKAEAKSQYSYASGQFTKLMNDLQNAGTSKKSIAAVKATADNLVNEGVFDNAMYNTFLTNYAKYKKYKNIK